MTLPPSAKQEDRPILEGMRILLQRVTEASVTVDGAVIGRIGPGMLIFLGIGPHDGPREAQYLLEKVLGLRIFDDPSGKMNLNIRQVGGELLIVSQFTLFADTRRGLRPSFDRAAPPAMAQTMYEYFIELAINSGIHVETGRFGAAMDVALHNDGPVTLWLDTIDKFGPEADINN